MVDIGEAKVVVLGTGGTIAGTASTAGDNVGYTAAQVTVRDLLAAIPGLPRALGGRQLVTEQVAQVDSKDMSVAIWRDLAARCLYWLQDSSVQGIVITHGTDTLEETAWFLQTLLNPRKPVVLTCAMRPSTALAPDGPQNLLDAVAAALDPAARGVLAVCAGVVHGAEAVRKVDPYRLDAFDSGDAGPLGFVEEGRVRWVNLLPEMPKASVKRTSDAVRSILDRSDWPWVELISSHAGASGAMVDLLVQGGVQGLVVIGTGNGTVHHELEGALLRAAEQGIAVVRATRCPQGCILPTSKDRLPHSNGLSPVKARVSMMLDLLGAQRAH